MKNIVIILTFFVFAASLSTVVFLFQEELTAMIENTQKSTTAKIIPATGISIDEESTQEDENLSREEIVQKKLDTIKRRLALKRLIIQGDSYYRNQQLPLALKNYLEFYKQNPKDELIIEKLADTYFQMKKYGSALNYYSQLSQGDVQKRKILIESFLYSSNIRKEGFSTELTKFLETYSFTEQEKYYYTQSASCLTDFHVCKLGFEEYFLQKNAEGNLLEIEFVPLADIKSAIENYKNFKVDEVYLKNAYMLAAWYSAGHLPLAIELGKEILTEKSGYKPVLKIIAQSYFELGEYEKAREALGDFYKIDESDAAIAYMLGVVNEKLREYVLANIYFNKSLSLGYSPSIIVRRQIIHNFYLLDNITNLLKSFSDLVEKEEVLEENDLGLAIYYYIINDKLEQALLWSKKGKILFPEAGDFYAYEGWILREQGRLRDALDILSAGIKIDEENAFIYINIAYTLGELKNKPASLIYFKKVVEIDSKSDYALQAQKEIDILTKK